MSLVKVLILDDDALILDMIKKMSEDKIDATCVETLAAAKKSLDKNQFDLIVSRKHTIWRRFRMISHNFYKK